jgi:hypothetical protein
MPTTYFTLPEAQSKLRRRIVTTVPFVDISANSTGRVTSYYKMGKLYGLTIKWDHANIEDGFSKDDYEEFLREI